MRPVAGSFCVCRSVARRRSPRRSCRLQDDVCTHPVLVRRAVCEAVEARPCAPQSGRSPRHRPVRRSPALHGSRRRRAPASQIDGRLEVLASCSGVLRPCTCMKKSRGSSPRDLDRIIYLDVGFARHDAGLTLPLAVPIINRTLAFRDSRAVVSVLLRPTSPSPARGVQRTFARPNPAILNRSCTVTWSCTTSRRAMAITHR
jgi:hypothetical protein